MKLNESSCIYAPLIKYIAFLFFYTLTYNTDHQGIYF